MTDATSHKTVPSPNSASNQKAPQTTTAAPAGADTAKPAAPKAAPKPKADKAEGAGRGRVSQFSGMILKATVETNTRREGSHGHKSLGIILAAGKPGISYEDYTAKGGRLNDLVWDVNKDNVEVSKAPAKA